MKGVETLDFFSSGKTLSIDFGANEIKVVEGKYSKKGVVVNKSFAVKVPQGLYLDGEILDMDGLAYALKTGLTQNKVSGGDVHAVVNSSKVIMREISMPLVSDEHIESILSYQLEDYIPIHSEDYVVKYIKLGTIYEDNVEKVNLLLIGVPRTIVETHLNLLKNVNLKPAVMDYQGNAISKLIRTNDSINNFYSNKDTIASVDIGYDSTSLTIIEDGVIKVSRSIEGGANELIKSLRSELGLAEEKIFDMVFNISDISEEVCSINEDSKLCETTRNVLQNIIDRVEMIFRYYKTREIGNDINLILLSGGLSKIVGIEKLFTDFFDKPSVKMNSLNKIKFNGDLPKYANAIGGLIRVVVLTSL